MFEHVAVVQIAPGEAGEPNQDAHGLAGKHAHGVLETLLACVWRVAVTVEDTELLQMGVEHVRDRNDLVRRVDVPSPTSSPLSPRDHFGVE